MKAISQVCNLLTVRLRGLGDSPQLKAFRSMFSGRTIFGSIPAKDRMDRASSQEFLLRLRLVPLTLPLIFGFRSPAYLSPPTAHTHMHRHHLRRMALATGNDSGIARP